MVATTAPMPPALRDPTSRDALRHVERTERCVPLMTPIAERVLDQYGEVRGGNEALLRLLVAAKRAAG